MEPQFHVDCICCAVLEPYASSCLRWSMQRMSPTPRPEIRKARKLEAPVKIPEARVPTRSSTLLRVCPPQARAGGGGQTRCRRRTLVDLSGIPIITGLADLSLEQHRRMKSSNTLISRSSFCSFPRPFSRHFSRLSTVYSRAFMCMEIYSTS